MAPASRTRPACNRATWSRSARPGPAGRRTASPRGVPGRSRARATGPARRRGRTGGSSSVRSGAATVNRRYSGWSCATNPMRARPAGRSSRSGSPNNRTTPSVGRSSPIAKCSSVVFRPRSSRPTRGAGWWSGPGPNPWCGGRAHGAAHDRPAERRRRVSRSAARWHRRQPRPARSDDRAACALHPLSPPAPERYPRAPGDEGATRLPQPASSRCQVPGQRAWI